MTLYLPQSAVVQSVSCCHSPSEKYVLRGLEEFFYSTSGGAVSRGDGSEKLLGLIIH